MKKYKLTFLGVNSFFSNGIDQFHSNILLEDEDENALLIDAGTDVKVSLKKAGKDVAKINAIYISHLHQDHAGALEWLGFYNYFISKKKPKLYTHITNVRKIWKMLKPSMEALDNKNAKMKDYFDVAPLHNEFSWSGIRFDLVHADHITNNKNYMKSFGLFFEINGKNILFTSDTCKNFSNTEYAEKASIIFHDCETYGLVMPPGSKVHAHYEDLIKADPEIKAKTWLYHYQSLEKNMPDAYKDGFAGFVKTGQVFEF